jgi:predicted DNA-binding transcriptional regulator AlpA
LFQLDGDYKAMEEFVTFRELRDCKIQYSRIHINRLMKSGKFPPAVWLSPNKKVWRMADIAVWQANRPTERPAA